MQNLINWIEIPATNIHRAINFYSAILDLEIQEAEFLDQKWDSFHRMEPMFRVPLC